MIKIIYCALIFAVPTRALILTSRARKKLFLLRGGFFRCMLKMLWEHLHRCPQNGAGAVFGLRAKNAATPAAPKSCQHGCEPNKWVGAPVSAPVWQDPIESAGTSRQLQFDAQGPIASDAGHFPPLFPAAFFPPLFPAEEPSSHRGNNYKLSIHRRRRGHQSNGGPPGNLDEVEGGGCNDPEKSPLLELLVIFFFASSWCHASSCIYNFACFYQI
jgi:hypothetical protein